MTSTSPFRRQPHPFSATQIGRPLGGRLTVIPLLRPKAGPEGPPYLLATRMERRAGTARLSFIDVPPPHLRHRPLDRRDARAGDRASRRALPGSSRGEGRGVGGARYRGDDAAPRPDARLADRDADARPRRA